MRLSIVVPCYNVEEYLERCISSCEKQDIPKADYEIIIVNDGSSDHSLEIANGLENRYDNITIITQPNQGLSCARNTGMLNAKGCYIWFVDSDDCVYENCVDKILTICEKHDLDICHFSYELYDSDGTVIKKAQLKPSCELMRGKDALLKHSDTVVGSAWSNFYKRSFLVNNNLLFIKGLHQQDVELNGRAFSIAQRCMLVDKVMYRYYYNMHSISKNSDIEKRKKYVGDAVVVAALHKDYFLRENQDVDLRLFFDRHVNSRIASGIRSMIRNSEDKQVIEEFVRVAIEKGLYPVLGPFLSVKWVFLRPVINHHFFWWMFKFI